MSPSDVVTAARSLYNATADTFFSDTQIYYWMWQGQIELAERAWIIESVSTSSTVASTQGYAYPTNAIAIKRVTVNGKKLKRITFREDDAVTLSNQASATTGQPIYYTDFNSTIYLRPIPDAVYTMGMYSYLLPTVPSSTGTLDVPTMFHFALVDYCLYRMFTLDKDPTNMQFFKTEWEKHVAGAIAYTQRKKRTDSMRTVQSEETLPVTILGEA